MVNSPLITKSKSSAYDDHISRLYEEMESQIRSERARLAAQELHREKELKEKMERELAEKERALQESIAKQQQLERSWGELSSLECEQKQENERLARANALLEGRLVETARSLEDSRSTLSALRTRGEAERRQRATQACRSTEHVAEEREGLVRELGRLRYVEFGCGFGSSVVKDVCCGIIIS